MFHNKSVVFPTYFFCRKADCEQSAKYFYDFNQVFIIKYVGTFNANNQESKQKDFSY